MRLFHERSITHLFKEHHLLSFGVSSIIQKETQVGQRLENGHFIKVDLGKVVDYSLRVR